MTKRICCGYLQDKNGNLLSKCIAATESCGTFLLREGCFESIKGKEKAKK